MGVGSRAFLAGSLGFAVAGVVACGSSNGLLTGAQSSSLADQLNTISSAISSHQCGQVANAAAALTNAVVNLSSVNTTLAQDLNQGAGTVSQLAIHDCTSTSSSSSSSSSSTTSSSSSTSTSSSPSATSSSTTSSPTTSSSSSSPTTSSSSSAPLPPTPTTPSGGAPPTPGGTGNTGNGQ